VSSSAGAVSCTWSSRSHPGHRSRGDSGRRRRPPRSRILAAFPLKVSLAWVNAARWGPPAGSPQHVIAAHRARLRRLSLVGRAVPSQVVDTPHSGLVELTDGTYGDAVSGNCRHPQWSGRMDGRHVYSTPAARLQQRFSLQHSFVPGGSPPHRVILIKVWQHAARSAAQWPSAGAGPAAATYRRPLLFAFTSHSGGTLNTWYLSSFTSHSGGTLHQHAQTTAGQLSQANRSGVQDRPQAAHCCLPSLVVSSPASLFRLP